MTLPEISSMFGSFPPHGPVGTGLGSYTHRLGLPGSLRGTGPPPPGTAARSPSPGGRGTSPSATTASTVTSLSADTDGPSSPTTTTTPTTQTTTTIKHRSVTSFQLHWVSLSLTSLRNIIIGNNVKSSVSVNKTRSQRVWIVFQFVIFFGFCFDFWNMWQICRNYHSLQLIHKGLLEVTDCFLQCASRSKE